MVHVRGIMIVVWGGFVYDINTEIAKFCMTDVNTEIRLMQTRVIPGCRPCSPICMTDFNTCCAPDV